MHMQKYKYQSCPRVENKSVHLAALDFVSISQLKEGNCVCSLLVDFVSLSNDCRRRKKEKSYVWCWLHSSLNVCPQVAHFCGTSVFSFVIGGEQGGMAGEAQTILKFRSSIIFRLWFWERHRQGGQVKNIWGAEFQNFVRWVAQQQKPGLWSQRGLALNCRARTS